MARIDMLVYTGFIYGLPVTGPTATRIEFFIGGEQRLSATNTVVHTFIMVIVIRPRKRVLGTTLPSYTVLLIR